MYDPAASYPDLGTYCPEDLSPKVAKLTADVLMLKNYNSTLTKGLIAVGVVGIVLVVTIKYFYNKDKKAKNE